MSVKEAQNLMAGMLVGEGGTAGGDVFEGKCIVITGPSGVGKGTLIEKLKKEFPDAFGFSVSHTTRAPREGEVNGVHYNFAEKETMQKEIAAGFFVESAEVHGNYYGTSKAAVEKVINGGKLCILDIDVQGARLVRAAGIPGKFIFIKPPSIEVLESRLRGRGTEKEEAIQKRLGNAKGEIDASTEEGLFDHVITNEDLEKCYEELKGLVKADVAAVQALNDPNVVSKKATPLVVFVLGGPGAGKGTQCANVVSEFGWKHLSAGDLLREEQASGSPDAEMINNFIKEGKIVPVEVTIKLLLAAMSKSVCNKFLIDGFPRSIDNYEGWVRVVGDKANVAFCLFYECTEDQLQERLLKRGETSGRSDDNLESIMKRFQTFKDNTMPVVDMFSTKHALRKVSSAQSKEAVWAETKPLFVELFSGAKK